MLRILFFIIVLVSPSVFAQTEEKPKPILFDEFSGFNMKELKSKTEKFKVKFQEFADTGTAAYLIFYSGENRKPSNRLEINVRDTLYNNCNDCFGYSPSIVFVRSGMAKVQKVQFWIVPLGATPPKP